VDVSVRLRSVSAGESAIGSNRPARSASCASAAAQGAVTNAAASVGGARAVDAVVEAGAEASPPKPKLNDIAIRERPGPPHCCHYLEQLRSLFS